jgi:hypothetical protein
MYLLSPEAKPGPLEAESYSSTTPTSPDQVVEQTCRLVSSANLSFSREVNGFMQVWPLTSNGQKAKIVTWATRLLIFSYLWPTQIPG